MLVNFAVEPETLSAGQLIGNFKRGSWMKKRIDAKRILHSNKKHTASVVQTPAPVVVQPKAAENNIAAPAVSSFGMKRSAPVSENQAAAKRLKAPAGFTSSIFTSNPTISVAAKPEKKQIAQPIFSDTVFAGLGLHSVLVNHLTKLKLVTPTPIQRAAIPVLVKSCDKDAIIQAQTGSGKTYCFLLPILERLIVAAAEHEKQQGSDFFSRATGTFAIILAPTRELAQQIETVLNTLLRYTSGSNQEDEDQSFRHWIVSGIVTGGEKRKSEKSRLRKGISILVATPGRLLDHLKTTDAFMIGNLRWLILDEADNLLNLGFEETLKEILEILEFKRKLAIQHNYRISIPSLPEMRQTILCSATIESGVQALAKQALVDPEFITGKTEKDETKTEDPADNAIAIPQQLKQQYVIAPAKLRLVGMVGLIRHLVATVKSAKIIIYLSTGDSVDWHFDSFARLGEAPNRDGDVEELTESEQAEKQAKDETANRKKLEDGYDTPLSPGTLLFKLHGSMCQTDRQATFAGFSRQKNGSSVLLCAID